MKTHFRICLCLALLTMGPVRAQEWESLFDGKTLAGWKANESPGSFKVSDGAIKCDGARSHLFYVGTGGGADFRNFELAAEVKARNGANSGIYFHTAFQDEGWLAQGLEAQVLNERPTQGGYRENKLTGSLYGIRNIYKSVVNDDDWFTMRVSVIGKRVQIRVNDVLLVDYLEPSPAPAVPNAPGHKLGHGTFALQCHDAGSKVSFRNVRVKRLPDNLADPGTAAPAFTEYDREILRLGAANYPVVNYHVHLKGGLRLDEALASSRETGVFYGIALNCGLNFSVTNDVGIYDYLKTMERKPVFVAMQAEGREWVNLFSKEAIARFDYVFTDAMTFSDDSGRRMRLWIPDEVPEIKDKQAFMELLVRRAEKILSTEPVDIYVNPTFLPDSIAAEYDELWTEERMKRVIAAAAGHNIAIEINDRYRIPSPAFLRLAKAAGCKFTFGTNNGDRQVGRIGYGLEMVKALNLQWQDIWVPKTFRSGNNKRGGAGGESRGL